MIRFAFFGLFYAFFLPFFLVFVFRPAREQTNRPRLFSASTGTTFWRNGSSSFVCCFVFFLAPGLEKVRSANRFGARKKDNQQYPSNEKNRVYIIPFFFLLFLLSNKCWTHVGSECNPVHQMAAIDSCLFFFFFF